MLLGVRTIGTDRLRVFRGCVKGFGIASIDSIKGIRFRFFLSLFIGLVPLFLQGSEPSNLELVDVRSFIPGICVDLKYGTSDNFTGQIVYRFNACLLRKETALRLRDVQEELDTMGLALKIWDGFRPIEAQRIFWKLLPDERYVSDPKKGGRHTRGTAVDLTLITKEGQELPMPSGFDDFSEKAHQDYMQASDEAIGNREFLREIMERHGFTGLFTEWWHFDLIGWESCPSIESMPRLLDD